MLRALGFQCDPGYVREIFLIFGEVRPPCGFRTWLE
jgi:hypothetical protein